MSACLDKGRMAEDGLVELHVRDGETVDKCVVLSPDAADRAELETVLEPVRIDG